MGFLNIHRNQPMIWQQAVLCFILHVIVITWQQAVLCFIMHAIVITTCGMIKIHPCLMKPYIIINVAAIKGFIRQIITFVHDILCVQKIRKQLAGCCCRVWYHLQKTHQVYKKQWTNSLQRHYQCSHDHQSKKHKNMHISIKNMDSEKYGITADTRSTW